MPTLSDLKRAYYEAAVGVTGLSISDLEYLYFSGGYSPVAFGNADPSTVDVLYTPAPTPTTALWVDPSATHTLYATDTAGTNFNYRGGSDIGFGGAFPDTIMAVCTSQFPHTVANGGSQTIWSAEFITDAPEFKLYFKHLAATATYRMKVNGKRVTDLPVSTNGTTIGSRHTLSWDFAGDTTIKRICLEFANVPFGGIYVPKNSNLWKPQPYTSMVAILGDSIGGGSAQNTGSGQGTWIPRLADQMGWVNPWNSCIGGTGYITANGGANTFVDRVNADVLVYNPDKVILFGGYNDNLGSQPAILAAARSVAASIQGKSSVKKVAMVGPYSPVGPAVTSIVNTNDTLKTVALENGWIFVDQINGDAYAGNGTKVMDSTPWISGTGRVGATTGTGNADYCVGTDGIHPTDRGHKNLADRMYRSLVATGF